MTRPSRVFRQRETTVTSVRWALAQIETEKVTEKRCSLCANMTETSCVTAISEGGKENQHGNDERFLPTRYKCDGSI